MNNYCAQNDLGIKVRTIKIDDAQDIFEVTGDPKQMALYGNGKPRTKEETVNAVGHQVCMNATDPLKTLTLIITDISGSIVLGRLKLYNLPHSEIDICIVPSKQEHGYAKHSILALLAAQPHLITLLQSFNYGSVETATRQIKATTHPDNVKSVHIFEKAGFKQYRGLTTVEAYIRPVNDIIGLLPESNMMQGLCKKRAMTMDELHKIIDYFKPQYRTSTKEEPNNFITEFNTTVAGFNKIIGRTETPISEATIKEILSYLVLYQALRYTYVKDFPEEE
jgi:RimJ/RimL family protein N-acetyltransferase